MLMFFKSIFSFITCTLIYRSYTLVTSEYVHLGNSKACLKLFSINAFPIKHASPLVLFVWVVALSFDLLYKLEINFKFYDIYDIYQPFHYFLLIISFIHIPSYPFS